MAKHAHTDGSKNGLKASKLGGEPSDSKENNGALKVGMEENYSAKSKREYWS